MSLFEPVRHGRLDLPNRLVMAPMTRSRAGLDGVPTPSMATYYAQRASAGLILTEGTQPSPQGQGHPMTPGIHTDEQVAGWRAVTDAVHAAGGRIFLQIQHAGRVGHPSVHGLTPVAPSAVRADGQIFTPEGPKDLVEPRALTTAEVPDVVREFVRAAERGIEAGFDGVELHGAMGFLLHQFLAANSNRRTDAYGGPVENRIRFAVEVVEAVAAAIGADRVGLRISPGRELNDIAEGDSIALYTALLDALAPLGLAHLHLAASDDEELNDKIRANWPGTLVVNPLNSFPQPPADAGLENAERWLERGADLIAFGRGFLANPDLVARFRTGAPLNEINPEGLYGGGDEGYTDYPALAAPPLDPPAGPAGDPVA
ncbi:alkene reductase [Streptomyces cavernicola]|uniref:Alkene reductase n=1 Tax=Streptomyces cavernicola TaxID=3043613 RepID=A0ABT6SAD0_9ACTN|nr:alkene reductase [Streptomyces sp. B-S-A6]MDI3405137.1 alkene reductase [Streptomyces sp. B-S-A6]